MVLQRIKFAPLSSTFMAVSILGLVISFFYINKVSPTWALAFGIVFFCMLIASFISMEKANPDAQLFPRPRK